jgi:hypothetical protein
MGNCLNQYRAAIGLFGGGSGRGANGPHRKLSVKFCAFWAIFMLMACMNVEVDPWVVLLLICCMDIESNPGPIQSKISFCNVNIRSLNALSRDTGNIPRFMEFKNALAGTYDVITCTESWLTSEHPDENYNLPGYVGPYRVDRSDDTGHGGVAAWVIDTLYSEHRRDLEQQDHETLWISVNNKETQVLIGISYRQKRGNYAPDYWVKLQAGYDSAIATKIPNVMLVGDFNADPGNDKTSYDVLTEFISLNNLHQFINEPTRVTSGSASILDLIITNLPNLVTEVGVGAPVHENDHRTIFGKLNLKTIKRKNFVREMWDFKHANFDDFRERLSNVDWEDCFTSDNIDDICKKWSDLFMTTAESCIGKKRVKIRIEDKNWYNNYLRRLKRFKDREYGNWVKNRSDNNWEIYKTARNKYFQECDRLKLEYEEHIYATLASEIDKNPKKWWSLVGQTMGTSKKSSYPVMIKNGIFYSTDKEKADLFNETYLESSNLSGDHFDLPDEENTPQHELLDEIIILEKDVDDIIKGINTNKAYGPDNISPRLIKEAGPVIVKVLTRIFNRSLQLAKFPSIWKCANVLPIFKKAEAFLASNYRPVSLLSVLAKVFEKIVFKYLFNYFRDHFLITIWQSGFLPGSSTVTQLTEIYDQFCRAVCQGKEIRVVFLDISKAFDRVWHRGLLYKLKSCGITGKLLEWLKDYLTDRQQRVIVMVSTRNGVVLKQGFPRGRYWVHYCFLYLLTTLCMSLRNVKSGYLLMIPACLSK